MTSDCFKTRLGFVAAQEASVLETVVREATARDVKSAARPGLELDRQGRSGTPRERLWQKSGPLLSPWRSGEQMDCQIAVAMPSCFICQGARLY